MYSLETLSGLHISPSLGALTVSGANETLKVTTPSGQSASLLQTKALSNRFGLAEVWIPVGVYYTVTTTTTVNAAILTLRKNGVSAATGGLVTIPVIAASTTVAYAPISAWTFAAAPAAGDQWSLLVTTTASAGVIGATVGTFLAYAVGAWVGVSDAVAE